MLNPQKLFRRFAHRDRIRLDAGPGLQSQRGLLDVDRKTVDNSAPALRSLGREPRPRRVVRHLGHDQLWSKRFNVEWQLSLRLRLAERRRIDEYSRFGFHGVGTDSERNERRRRG